MSDSLGSAALNDNHARHVVTTFRYMDDLLSKAEHIVEFAEARPQTVELPALAEFATEQQNPANTKHVARIRVQLPAARLREGITFVDTPGLGSLAVAGAAETVAYLPRCDLGIVLVDAASTLTKEDLQVIQAIYAAGATAMVLVSKADLLKPADRERAADYVRKQVRAEVNVEPFVHLVSVVEAEARLCQEWFDSDLRPVLDTHRELTALSLKRKIGGLREALLATLKRRVESRAGESGKMNPARLHEVEHALRSAAQTLEAAQEETRALARNISDLEESLIDTTADDMAAQWLRRESPGPADVFSATAARLLTGESAKVLHRIEQVRVQLAETLQGAAQVFPSAKFAVQELPRPTGLPLPDPSAVARELDLRRPAVLPLFGRAALRSHLRPKLRDELGPKLRNFLGLHGQRLSEWAKRTLAALEAAFSSSAEIFRAQLEQHPQAKSSEPEKEGEHLRRDIALLETWEKGGTPEPVLFQ